MSRCIDCYRCVRICDEVQGQFVWHVRNRGLLTRASGPTVPTCSRARASAAARASTPARPARSRTRTCPRSKGPRAGRERRVRTAESAARWTSGARSERIVSIRPVLDAPVSKGHLCVKGRYAFEFVSAGDRVTEPMIRDEGELATRVLERGPRVRRRPAARPDRAPRPDSVGVLGSARATNEDNYVAQKFARVVIGTNNVDCCARVCHAPSAAALKRMLGVGLSTKLVRRHRDRAHDSRLRREPDREPPDRRRAHQTGRSTGRASHRHRSAAHRAGGVCRPLSADQAGDQHPPPERDGAHDRRPRDCAIARSRNAAWTASIDSSSSSSAWPPERAAAICGVDADAIRDAARALRHAVARDERSRPWAHRARAGHRRRDGADQPRRC